MIYTFLYICSLVHSCLSLQKTTANKADLSTLMWRENNTREFEKVEIDWNDKVDLFPNSHFGFNGRQLLTTAVQVN